MTNNLLFPHASFLGFENLFQQLERATDHQLPQYPPCNIIKYGDNSINIELAVAGFNMNELDVECDKSVLTIKGQKSNLAAEPQRHYVHHGISQKKFIRKFTLAEHIEVTGAALISGILTIQLKHIVPDEFKPRKIIIKEPQELLAEEDPEDSG